MAEPWSDEERGMLREMWLCGVSSTDIAGVVGRTRHAVMGRVQKSGLMKRQSAGLMRPCDADMARTAVEHSLVDYATGRGDPIYDAVARVVMALVADGRGSRRLPAVTGIPAAEARAIVDALEDTAVWPRRSGPPPLWWTEGYFAVRADLRRVANHIRSQQERAHAA